MAVPKRKISPSRRDKRRSHDRISNHEWQECTQCGEMKLPHNVCGSCGHYNGKEIIVANEQDDDDS